MPDAIDMRHARHKTDDHPGTRRFPAGLHGQRTERSGYERWYDLVDWDSRGKQPVTERRTVGRLLANLGRRVMRGPRPVIREVAHAWRRLTGARSGAPPYPAASSEWPTETRWWWLIPGWGEDPEGRMAPATLPLTVRAGSPSTGEPEAVTISIRGSRRMEVVPARTVDKLLRNLRNGARRARPVGIAVYKGVAPRPRAPMPSDGSHPLLVPAGRCAT